MNFPPMTLSSASMKMIIAPMTMTADQDRMTFSAMTLNVRAKYVITRWNPLNHSINHSSIIRSAAVNPPEEGRRMPLFQYSRQASFLLSSYLCSTKLFCAC